jgi:hypothetical protein
VHGAVKPTLNVIVYVSKHLSVIESAKRLCGASIASFVKENGSIILLVNISKGMS